jgi:hypothetical protein
MIALCLTHAIRQIDYLAGSLSDIMMRRNNLRHCWSDIWVVPSLGIGAPDMVVDKHG